MGGGAVTLWGIQAAPHTTEPILPAGAQAISRRYVVRRAGPTHVLAGSDELFEFP